MNNQFDRNKLLLVKRYLKKGRILDAGCGDGWLVKELRKDGYQVNGIESSPIYIKEFISDTIDSGDMLETGYKSKTFDTIACIQVLERRDEMR